MDTLESIIGQKVPNQPSRTIIMPGDLPPPQLNDQSPAATIAKNMEVYFENPWAMVEDGHIWTHDEVDLLHPVKRFPNNPWLEQITSLWLTENLFAVYKSRRMMITWLMVFLHLWLAMFREGAAIYFVSDKEEKSDELVQRASFIFDHISDDAVLKPVAKLSYCYLEFPGLNSFIMGVPQGANQLRQYGATAVLADEFAFWDKARETFMATKPTVDGGGKFTAISSPGEGFFKELCFDLIR